VLKQELSRPYPDLISEVAPLASKTKLDPVDASVKHGRFTPNVVIGLFQGISKPLQRSPFTTNQLKLAFAQRQTTQRPRRSHDCCRD
jgi:hypothetical protein